MYQKFWLNPLMHYVPEKIKNRYNKKMVRFKVFISERLTRDLMIRSTRSSATSFPVYQGLDDKIYTVFCNFLPCLLPYFTCFQRNFNILSLFHILFCLYNVTSGKMIHFKSLAACAVRFLKCV